MRLKCYHHVCLLSFCLAEIVVALQLAYQAANFNINELWSFRQNNVKVIVLMLKYKFSPRC